MGMAGGTRPGVGLALLLLIVLLVASSPGPHPACGDATSLPRLSLDVPSDPGTCPSTEGASCAVMGPPPPRGTEVPLAAYNEFAWSNLSASTSSPSPSVRQSAGLVDDPLAHELVLFGGTDQAGYPLDDTWTFVNGTWMNISAGSSAPPAREGAGIAWDPSDNEIVLFGGVGFTGTLFNDTWTFQGGVWTNRTALLATAPPPLYAPTLTTDSSDDLVLLTGGAAPSGPNGATWAFQHGAWKNITSSSGPGPSPRLWSESSDDPFDQGVLLFGGYNDNASYYSDTWLFRAGVWKNLTSALIISPPAVIQGSLMVEAANASLVLVQGSVVPPDGIPYPDQLVWVWQSGRWTNATALNPTLTPERSLAATATLPLDGGMGVLFGGQGPINDLADLELLHPQFAANASISPVLLPVGADIHYNSTAAGGVPPILVTWSFGDGTTSTQASGSHPYGSAADYTVAFAATDAVGETVYQNISVRVVVGLAVSILADPNSTDVGREVAFSSEVLGGSAPYTYLWSFGDGSPSSNLAAPSHLFSSEGVFPATLSVSDPSGTQGQAETNITVRPVLELEISSAPSIPAPGSAVAFSSVVTGGTPPISLSWNFGDGGSATGTSPEHTFASSGTFPVHALGTDAVGDVASTWLNITVSSTALPPFRLTVSSQPGTGEPSTLFQFNASANGGTPPYQFSWSFGDGTVATGAEVSHRFSPTSSTTYRVVVNGTDGAGDHATASLNVSVTVPSSEGNSTKAGPSQGAGSSLSAEELVGALVLVVAGALVATVLLRRRARAGKDPRGPAPNPGTGPTEGERGAEGAS